MTEEGKHTVQIELRAIAEKHGVSLDVVEYLFAALVACNGAQAQFNHPELGGLGQWSRGGMLMIGDMFNHSLKAKIAALCSDMADLATRSAEAQPGSGQHQSQYQGSGSYLPGIPGTGASNWWPKELGSPSATGAQNDMRYAFFPTSRRLALSVGGEVTVYDTRDHLIGGFSQQQSEDRSITFSSQHGRIDLSQLVTVPAAGEPSKEEKPGPPEAENQKAATSAPEPRSSDGDIFDKIERLAALHAKGILSDQEFEAKKSELLARL